MVLRVGDAEEQIDALVRKGKAEKDDQAADAALRLALDRVTLCGT